ncbi:MAG: host attachment protein [Bauldia sp.]|nr:host attachment protein [Bauldia sp.]
MLLHHDTLVVVADGRAMKIFRNAGSDIAPRLEARDSPKLGHDGHGSGGRHHSSAANPDAAQLDEDSFAATVAGWLNAEALAGRIVSLVVVAPPRALGEIRRHYHPELEKRLVAEVARELVEASAVEVQAAVLAARGGEAS